MANLAISDVEKSMVWLTLKLLGYNPDDASDQVQSKVRLSYQNAPYQEITDDVCYLYVSFSDSPVNRPLNYQYTNVGGIYKRQAGYCRVLEIQWVFYGNNCSDIANKFRFDLFSQYATDYMDSADIRIIYDVPEVVMTRELFQDKWWERCDLTVKFNNTYQDEAVVNNIQSASLNFETTDMVKNVIVSS